MKKAPTKNKKVTIDDLAIMVARGFESVHNEIEEFQSEVNKKFEVVNERFEGLDESIATTNNNVLSLGDRSISSCLRPRRESGDSEFDKHLIRFSDLERKVKTKVD
ncbi:MAG TPA: hypothetical protein DCS23_03580 [Candidatus Yonathbacteria bacterium]|nr:hypothetical protein [Candidatus Yonathbacteria bacterium]